MLIRSSFPQVYALNHPTTGKYWLVSARSKKWGMKERKVYQSEKDSLDYARQIEKSIQTNGAQPNIQKEKIGFVTAHEKLIERLNPFSKTPEDAVNFYIVYLGNEALKQAKPFIKDLVIKWETEKLTSKIRPLSGRTKTELKQ